VSRRRTLSDCALALLGGVGTLVAWVRVVLGVSMVSQGESWMPE
jgi:hypothetical protein